MKLAEAVQHSQKESSQAVMRSTRVAAATSRGRRWGRQISESVAVVDLTERPMRYEFAAFKVDLDRGQDPCEHCGGSLALPVGALVHNRRISGCSL